MGQGQHQGRDVLEHGGWEEGAVLTPPEEDTATCFTNGSNNIKIRIMRKTKL